MFVKCSFIVHRAALRDSQSTPRYLARSLREFCLPQSGLKCTKIAHCFRAPYHRALVPLCSAAPADWKLSNLKFHRNPRFSLASQGRISADDPARISSCRTLAPFPSHPGFGLARVPRNLPESVPVCSLTTSSSSAPSQKSPASHPSLPPPNPKPPQQIPQTRTPERLPKPLLPSPAIIFIWTKNSPAPTLRRSTSSPAATTPIAAIISSTRHSNTSFSRNRNRGPSLRVDLQQPRVPPTWMRAPCFRNCAPCAIRTHVASVFGVLRRTDPPLLAPDDDPGRSAPAHQAEASLERRSLLDQHRPGRRLFFLRCSRRRISLHRRSARALRVHAENAEGRAAPFQNSQSGACYEYNVDALPTGKIHGSVLGPDGKSASSCLRRTLSRRALRRFAARPLGFSRGRRRNSNSITSAPANIFWCSIA